MQRQRSYHLKKELKGVALGSGRWKGNGEIFYFVIMLLFYIVLMLFYFYTTKIINITLIYKR